MASPLRVAFVGGSSGLWKVDRVAAVIGESLPTSECIDVIEGGGLVDQSHASWILQGVTSNTRYTRSVEVAALSAVQAGLSRSEATRAALIPIRKNEAWWALAQDERRAIFEEQSRHIGIGLDYLPGVARRLHHSRELGEPFDFLTWFEYAPMHEQAFEEMLRRLRATPEWRFVDREVDLRLSRA